MALPRFTNVKKLEGSGQSFDNYLKQINLLYPNIPDLYNTYADKTTDFLAQQIARVGNDTDIDVDYRPLLDAYIPLIAGLLPIDKFLNMDESGEYTELAYLNYCKNLFLSSISVFLTDDYQLTDDPYIVNDRNAKDFYMILLMYAMQGGLAVLYNDQEYLSNYYYYDLMREQAIEIFEIDGGSGGMLLYESGLETVLPDSGGGVTV